MRRVLLVSLALLLIPVSFRGDDLKELERKLKSEYKGKVLTLRHFHTGSELRFDSSGKLLQGGPEGPWTLNGKIEVKDVTLKKDHLEIDGNRLFLAYNQAKRQWRHIRSSEKVRVRLDLNPQGNNETSIRHAITNVFLSDQHELVGIVPAYWRHFLKTSDETALEQPKQDPNDDRRIYGSEGGVTPARCVSCPDPKYVLAARYGRVEGQVLIWAVINEKGQAEEMTIARPLGMGLDDAAVETLSRWKFEPAQRHGNPVPVYMAIEINFRLTPK